MYETVSVAASNTLTQFQVETGWLPGRAINAVTGVENIPVEALKAVAGAVAIGPVAVHGEGGGQRKTREALVALEGVNGRVARVGRLDAAVWRARVRVSVRDARFGDLARTARARVVGIVVAEANEVVEVQQHKGCGARRVTSTGDRHGVANDAKDAPRNLQERSMPFLSNVKNDVFLYATPDCLAVRGLGHFAMHLDGKLLQGSSGTCDTFGSPCLAGGDEFRCAHVEVWQVAAVQAYVHVIRERANKRMHVTASTQSERVTS
ncbi:hypothetical protein FOA52_009719 [Chlamydomonas sp. UWO 241]|nr:hypothetical protein FOA52_009719 [Chlamydomonas sp. UWO 241]